MPSRHAYHFIQRFYDSHPNLPLDPDSDQPQVARPMHTDWAHVAIVGVGGFFGTLARYEMSLWLPTQQHGWPMATFGINLIGAFLLGLLLQVLLDRGKDEGAHRILRLLVGTGFMGAFTTYSSLAVGVVTLARSGSFLLATMYAGLSVGLGMLAAAGGIWLASQQRGRKRRGTL